MMVAFGGKLVLGRVSCRSGYGQPFSPYLGAANDHPTANHQPPTTTLQRPPRVQTTGEMPTRWHPTDSGCAPR